MIPKQDRQGVRKATDIEQKYKLNMDTAEIEKMATNAMRTATSAQSMASSAVSTANSVRAEADKANDHNDAIGLSVVDGKLCITYESEG